MQIVALGKKSESKFYIPPEQSKIPPWVTFSLGWLQRALVLKKGSQLINFIGSDNLTDRAEAL